MVIQKDTDLIVRIQEGDVSAYELLVKRYQRPLIVFAFRIAGDIHAAEEIAQDALFSVYQTMDRVDPSKKFSTYLFAIAKNTGISYLRKKKSHISLDDREIAFDAMLYETVAQKDQAEGVRSALEKLPPKYRYILQLYYFKDLSYGDIAKSLQMPINTVRTHLKRAKEMLKKILTQ